MTSIIHSFPFWLPQTQTWMYNQVRYLPQDIDCHIVCERTENLDQFRVPNIHALREKSALRYYYDKAMIKLRLRRHSGWLTENIRTAGAALVHSHFGNIAWRDMWACRKLGTPQVATFYGQDVNFLPTAHPEWRNRYSELFESVAQVLCEGPHMASCIEALGCPADKIQVHHLGVALNDLPFRPREYLSTTPLRILIAGSFREKKGIPYALEALGRLAGRTKMEITIIGDSDGSPASEHEKRKILEAIEKHGLGGKTRMLGFQPHATLISEALEHHIFLSPSVTAQNGDTEGGAPVSIIEMSATGMPVVATRHCDIPEVVEDGVTGLLADERDIDGLEQCLIRLAEEPDTWAAMAHNARRHIERSFDARGQSAALEQIYRNTISA